MQHGCNDRKKLPQHAKQRLETIILAEQTYPILWKI